MCLHRCLYSHSVVVWRFRIYATDQFSGVFFRNHLGSKKNTSVIFVITFCNYPHATLLERRKTAVSLLPRSPSKHVLPFGGAACFKGGVTLLHLCQHSDETEKHSVDGKALIFKTWRPGQHIFCFCAIVKLAERVKRLFFSLNLCKRDFWVVFWCVKMVLIVVDRSQTYITISHDKMSAAGHLKHVQFIQLT